MKYQEFVDIINDEEKLLLELNPVVNVKQYGISYNSTIFNLFNNTAYKSIMQNIKIIAYDRWLKSGEYTAINFCRIIKRIFNENGVK
jgi:hypothetical protein